jgi:hypothetical protein
MFHFSCPVFQSNEKMILYIEEDGEEIRDR